MSKYDKAILISTDSVFLKGQYIIKNILPIVATLLPFSWANLRICFFSSILSSSSLSICVLIFTDQYFILFKYMFITQLSCKNSIYHLPLAKEPGFQIYIADASVFCCFWIHLNQSLSLAQDLKYSICCTIIH